MSTGEPIRIELTTDQQQQIKEFSGQEISALQFEAHELEQRIAPVTMSEITITKHIDVASPKLAL
jgi:type VI protein secretion system component Hcp